MLVNLGRSELIQEVTSDLLCHSDGGDGFDRDKLAVHEN